MPRISYRHRRYHHFALLLLVLLCGRCKSPGGPFVTVTITGIPSEAIKLTMAAKHGDMTRPVEATPSGVTLPLTIDLPPGVRGPLVVTAQALSPSCTLAAGSVTVELTEDTAYEVPLPLVDSPLAGCVGLTTLGLTLKRVESGGIGSVSSSPAGISCASDCTEQQARYRPGTEVTLIARPALGSRVTWSEGSCGGYRTCTVPVIQDTTVTATFSACAKGSWCDEGSPDVTRDLHGVWGTAVSTVYAVGDGGSILMRNASQWAPMTSGVLSNIALRAVGGDRANQTVYAGGDSGTLLNLTGPLTWTKVDEPLVAGKQITGIAGESSGAMIYLCTTEGGFYSKSGSTWSAITDNALNGKVLHGVSARNDFGGREATVVGDAGFVLRSTKTIVSSQIADNTSGSGTTLALRGIWSGGGLTVAVGDGGAIVTRDAGDYFNNNKTWKRITSPVASRLTAVWGGNDTNIWIVGDGGVILKYDGNITVTQQPNVPAVDLTGVWAADDNIANVYAVGRNGVILHYLP